MNSLIGSCSKRRERRRETKNVTTQTDYVQLNWLLKMSSIMTERERTRKEWCVHYRVWKAEEGAALKIVLGRTKEDKNIELETYWTGRKTTRSIKVSNSMDSGAFKSIFRVLWTIPNILINWRMFWDHSEDVHKKSCFKIQAQKYFQAAENDNLPANDKHGKVIWSRSQERIRSWIYDTLLWHIWL